ncbi:hypothetical protein AG1IA_00825 [Rhizoctonia solani AG-1 IA]|uniref:Uncharacterized protein n=1 Tax=Thanatephorus cucumeris (strain AG1-IA) TaxID=983506 RepID=L8X4L0_THACA|nr:hypothetical protein AG1IA_00825 [Rhizoctonia solani AG-1 IA]
MQVYSNPECAVMGLNIIDPNFDQDTIIKLQIATQPSTEVLLKLLSIDPPCHRDKAQKCYEYMASRIADLITIDFLPIELGYMAEIAFIPAPETRNPLQIDVSGSRAMLKPTQVYLGDGVKTEYEKSGIFTFIEFEGRAVTFLKAVGVKSTPTTEDVCTIMIQDPEGFRNAIGGYERWVVRIICEKSCWNVEPKNRAEAFLQIVIVDDVHSYALFGHEIWGAPQEDNIEVFYETLGAKRLTALISTDYTFLPVQNHLEAQEHASYIRALVLERLLLFLHNLTDVKPWLGIEWLAEGSNFQKVMMVCKLQITRTLKYARTRSVTQTISAAVKQEEFGSPIVLWINQGLELDFYEVASSMCNILFERNRTSNNMLFMTILSTSLTALKRRGYNADRIIHQKDLKKAWAEFADSQFRRKITESGITKVTPTVHVTQQIACPLAEENIECLSPELEVIGYSTRTGLEGSIEPIPLCGSSQPTAAPQRENISTWDRHSELSYLVAQKCQSMSDFGRLVIEPLRTLYNLPQSSIKIYYDPKASGSFKNKDVILLNLAYYEERHNEVVQGGSLHQALTYWYFSLARTMARIAYHPQDDQHGCYLRLIIESHMPEFLFTRKYKRIFLNAAASHLTSASQHPPAQTASQHRVPLNSWIRRDGVTKSRAL